MLHMNLISYSISSSGQYMLGIGNRIYFFTNISGLN